MIPENFRGRAARLPLGGFDVAGLLNGLEPEALLAVWYVECGGEPFLADGRPALLFEAHIFSRLTDGRFNRSHPTLSADAWNRALYSGSRAGEYERLGAAMALDRTAALMAASWGGCQILGCNHRQAGFKTVDAMVAALCESEERHLDAFLAFIRHSRLMVPLRARDWDRFARGYNGSAYRLNRYAERLADEYQRNIRAFDDGLLGPGDRGSMVRRAQRDLVRAGFPIQMDGVYGGMTARAVQSFRQRVGLPASDYLDKAAITALAEA
ncbi:N-acetylmuramidase domain-containing protein [Niveispirillum irakense]|uniref:N-acetylmuramidase domain-containing protein n=1 Tax=Niveispirillum irakense TaxID=34011 RepID=UPI00040FFDCF|nr:N-acetylmuramidase domain-containing protein [Niveispirillum irakense]